MPQETVELDEWWEGKTFEMFPQLPPEVRQMIWKESMPARYVNPRFTGSICLPGPPAAAYVCHESRHVALRFGAPHGIDEDHKKGNSIWFMPSKDIVVYGHNYCSSFMNRVCGTSIWNAVQRIAVRLPSHHDSGEWRRINRIARLPQLKEIFLIPTGEKRDRRLTNTTEWNPRVKSQIFGKDSYRVVEFDDARYSKIRFLLNSHRETRNLATCLGRARWDCRATIGGYRQPPQYVKFREYAIALFERAWLEGSGVWFSTLADGYTVNKTYDVKLALARMPTIRFGYGFFDSTDEKPSSYRRGVRYATHRKLNPPKHIFNHEFKQWQKFVPEQTYE